MAQFRTLTSRVVVLAVNDVDTDQIIPARYLKTTDKTGLGASLFADWRYAEDGSPRPGFVLNAPSSAGAAILLAGDNFGCGSSREHAPQALYRYGFRAIIAESFAEIFFGNSTTLAIPCVIAAAAAVEQLRQAIESDPSTLVTIDLLEMRVRSSGGLDFPVTMPGSAREALVSGRWDPIQELLIHEAAINAKACELHYI